MRWAPKSTWVTADVRGRRPHRRLGWEDAVAGCDYVLHVASSLGGGNAEKDPDSLIVPAREGTLRVLRAAVAAGVQRVVMTSSCAAATPPTRDDIVVDETVWTDPDQSGLTAYRRSKTVAERAAWDYIERADGSTQLTTVLPGAIFGPALTADNFGSLQILSRMLEGRVPRYPSLAFEVVDVRDVADLHIRAMIAPHRRGYACELRWESAVTARLAGRCQSTPSRAATRTPQPPSGQQPARWSIVGGALSAGHLIYSRAPAAPSTRLPGCRHYRVPFRCTDKEG